MCSIDLVGYLQRQLFAEEMEIILVKPNLFKKKNITDLLHNGCTGDLVEKDSTNFLLRVTWGTCRQGGD